MTPSSLIDLIGLIHDEFDRRSWRDSGNTARSLAVALQDGKSPSDAAAHASNRFLVQNDTSTMAVEDALVRVLRENPRPVRIPRPAVGIDESLAASPAPAVRTSRPCSTAASVARPSPVSRKWLVGARIAVGAIIVIASAIVVFVIPDEIHWTWLINHPSRLSLEGSAFFVAASLAGAIVFWRREFLVVACVPGILLILSLLGH